MTKERLAEIEAIIRQTESLKDAALLRELVSEIRYLRTEFTVVEQLLTKYRAAAITQIGAANE